MLEVVVVGQMIALVVIVVLAQKEREQLLDRIMTRDPGNYVERKTQEAPDPLPETPEEIPLDALDDAMIEEVHESIQ